MTAAVVLAGGRGRRLGGVDKAALVVDGRTLLDRALAAVAGCAPVVVVGPTAPAGVRRVREDPAYGGPAAGLLTGLAALPGETAYVVVLAVDLPGVTALTVGRLLAARPAAGDGAVLVDAAGRRQPALVVRAAALRAVAPEPEEWPGLPLRRLLRPLRLVEVAAVADEGRDVDTPADLRHWRAPS